LRTNRIARSALTESGIGLAFKELSIWLIEEMGDRKISAHVVVIDGEQIGQP
jgi:hypothetical protein